MPTLHWIGKDKVVNHHHEVPFRVLERDAAKSFASPAGSPANSSDKRNIKSLAALDNVEWWHRNPSRGKGFCINAAINAYPDFIVKTKSGKILVIEVKDDDRDNSDSAMKLKQGKIWETCAGRNKYRYLMIFKDNPIEGAEKLADAVKKIGMM